jgi:hypothetical protein
VVRDEDRSAGCRTVMSMAFSGVGTKVTGWELPLAVAVVFAQKEYNINTSFSKKERNNTRHVYDEFPGMIPMSRVSFDLYKPRLSRSIMSPRRRLPRNHQPSTTTPQQFQQP